MPTPLIEGASNPVKPGCFQWRIALAGAVIVLAGVTAYIDSFSGPLVLDDLPSILDNPTIRQLWPIGIPLSPPGGSGLTVEGRPILNLSLALNYAISGTGVWSYHALNLAVHLLAGLALFGIIRRTPFFLKDGSSDGTTAFAFAVALIWTVHPLQTESVSYVIQRAESLMGLFYLLTLYGFVRAVEVEPSFAEASAGEKAARHRPWLWFGLSWLACLFGMAAKEVMVSAPLIVFCYDRVFISGSWREAWLRRRGYYVALAASWLLLAWLAIGAGNRGGTSGIGSGVPVFKYWLTQPGAVAQYLRLCFWPASQVFDYGTPWVAHIPAILPQAFLLACLVAATVCALWRTPRWGFLGLVFFAVLAPTSLVPGNRQTMAEHRMYLALIPVLVAAFAAIAWATGKRSRLILPLLALFLAVPAILATHARNRTYESVLMLYSSDVAHRPNNPFAQANLGTALLDDGRFEEAVPRLKQALRLRPFYPIAEDNLGNALLRLGRPAEAADHYRAAIRQDPYFADPHNNLGRALLEENQIPAATVEIETALKLDPALIEARNNLAGALAREGRLPEAIAQYRIVLGAAPEYIETHNDLGIALAGAGDLPGAITHYREAIRLRPGYAEAHYNLANALSAAGRLPDAITEYREALRLSPANLSAHDNLGNALLSQGRATEAVAEYQAALGIDPTHALAHYGLANALLQLHRPDEAIIQYREAHRLQPDFAPARQMLEKLGAGP